MDLINNRYRVLKNIKQNRLFSAYLVSDVKKGHKPVQLNIINSEYIAESNINLFSKEFITISTIEDKHILKLYDFGVIELIDNKKIDNNAFFYVNEYMEVNSNFMQLVKNMNENEILDLFVEVCKTVNYLHLRGFVYGDININNFYVQDASFKFKDLATVELEKQDFRAVKEGHLVFKAPEILAGEKPSVASDIYSLGIFLYFICRKKIYETLNISKHVSKFRNLKDSYSGFSETYRVFLNKIAPVIRKMTENNINKRYNSIFHIIEDINRIFSKSYKAHRQEQIEKLNFKTKLIGREFEINSVINVYNSMVKSGVQEKLITVHGEYGIGKTKFLKELERLFRFKNVNVYSSYVAEEANNKKSCYFYEIIRRIIGESDKETLKRYKSDLSRIIPELGSNENIVSIEAFLESKEKIRILNNIVGFINDFLKGKLAVFIIDNLHRVSDFCIELLEHMYLRSKNIMFIFSYCDGEFKYNKKLVEFISKVLHKPNSLEIYLRGLIKEDAVLMIQDILRTPTKPISFGERVFSKTYGNPLFIEETMKNLLAEKIIYVDEITGNWNTQYDYDYSKLPIPLNMEQAVLTQINGIDNTSNDILKVLSIFNTGVSVEIIENILKIDKAALNESVGDLELKGIICKKIEDRGFVYDFSNRILKRLIKEKLDKGYKRAVHEIAAYVLERQYEEGIDNKEELIYHLEKSGQKEKAIKYCLKNADNMEVFNNREEAIKNLKKAVSLIEDEKADSRKIEFLFRIGRIYEDSGNISSAIEYYSTAEKLALSVFNYKYEIAVLNRMANIYFKKNDLEKSLNFIRKIEKFLDKPEILEKYIEEYLECKEIQARIYYFKGDYDKARDLCKKGINLCGEEYCKLKGLFYKNLGNIYLETSDTKQALECYKESKACFEKISFSEGIAIAINNIAVVYGDFYQDTETAISYLLKMKAISEKNHIIGYEAMAAMNLASFYYYDLNYELALQYVLEAVEISKDIEYENNVFHCYNLLSNIYLRLRNYKEAYKYYLLAEKELEEYPDHGKCIGVFYQMGAELFYTFGCTHKAEDFINNALQIYKNDESVPKWNSEILHQYINMYSKNYEDSILENIASIQAIMNNIKSPLKKLEIICDTSMILYEKGFIESALMFFNKSYNIKLSFTPIIIEVKLMFLKGVLSKRNNKFKFLTSAFNLSKNEKDKGLYFKVCNALGEYYFERKDYFYAVNYYFEAAEVIKKLVTQLPEEYRINFINSPHILKPFIMLTSMKRINDYGRAGNNAEKTCLVNNMDELNALLQYENFKDILINKHFIKSAKKIYNSYLPKGIRTVNDIIKNLYADPVKNLELISKYLAIVTLATKSLIITDSYDQNYYTIASSDGNNQVPQSKYIFEKVRATRKPLLITEELIKNNSEFNYINQGAKAVICIPIIMNSDEAEILVKEDKRKSRFNSNPIKGYLYLESERTLNNFNKEGLNKCIELSRLAGVIIEKYQLQISSSIDKLTGALTRKSLEDALGEHIDRANEFNSLFSIIMLDMDLFKQINDRFGHQAGDEALRRVCSVIRNNIRKNDICGRYGGEEFIIILPETDSKGAFVTAEKLRKKIEEAKVLGDKIPVTVSMGVASYPEHAQWKQELIEKADQALYVSKELGRNKCQLWSSEFSAKAKGTDKLTGIVSGNMVQDSRNVLVMLDIMELIKKDIKLQDKIFNFLGRVIEITESEYGMFFLVQDGAIKEGYARKIFEEDWVDIRNYNREIIKSVIDKKQGVYMIDWDEIPSYDSVTGAPDWNSVVVIPLIKSGEVKSILYLTVSIKKKEFKFEDYNFINTLCGLGAAIL
ncbi:diguanylate cyclase [Clostridium sp. SYSU_GA19001]|uniref:diguanylate cyclase n=1 Tax=Clostridium caldaquaticum TaxID=2940653 RepID=UPI0020773A45|nr:diguanylate cyclase [Clostridium caldaquaticum]MCM8710192.1 diguanylate cyclase [Clostridium caldaquaticum]